MTQQRTPWPFFLLAMIPVALVAYAVLRRPVKQVEAPPHPLNAVLLDRQGKPEALHPIRYVAPNVSGDSSTDSDGRFSLGIFPGMPTGLIVGYALVGQSPGGLGAFNLEWQFCPSCGYKMTVADEHGKRVDGIKVTLSFVSPGSKVNCRFNTNATTGQGLPAALAQVSCELTCTGRPWNIKKVTRKDDRKDINLAITLATGHGAGGPSTVSYSLVFKEANGRFLPEAIIRWVPDFTRRTRSSLNAQGRGKNAG